MSLHQKYTWHDFLREHPEKKGMMGRTSSDGKKAFEAAYKKHIKQYLKDRVEKLAKEQERISKIKKTKSPNVPALDAYLQRLERMIERTKAVAKGF